MINFVVGIFTFSMFNYKPKTFIEPIKMIALPS